MARPSTFVRATFDAICTQMAEGRTLREICRAEDMPPRSTVQRWVIADEPSGIAGQYARAREFQMETWADENVEIADDGSNDWIERANKRGEVEIALNREHIDRSRLRIDTRKWLMARVARKTYGDQPPKVVDDTEAAEVKITGGLPD
jgi:hypothetical protein